MKSHINMNYRWQNFKIAQNFPSDFYKQDFHNQNQSLASDSLFSLFSTPLLHRPIFSFSLNHIRTQVSDDLKLA